MRPDGDYPNHERRVSTIRRATAENSGTSELLANATEFGALRVSVVNPSRMKSASCDADSAISREPQRMCRKLVLLCVLIVAIVASPLRAEPTQSTSQVTATAERLISEIADWLVSNLDLPSISERPSIEFASDAQLERLRHQRSADSQAGGDASDETDSRSGAIALYDFSRRTIFLSENWIGTSPADQSVLVHEMVHHVQNMAKMKFECPMAREKLAYKAQNRWLARFGMDLESAFHIDPFTVLVNSACM